MANAAMIAPRHWLAYGALGLPLAMAALPIYVHVPRLYAEAGVSLSLLGGLLLGARLLDAAVDPLLGAWTDRARERSHLIALALPFLAGGMFGLLHPQPERTEWWLLVSLLATYFGFSLASIAYQAWGVELGENSRTRTLLTASREAFGLVGVIAASILPLLLENGTTQTLGSGLSRLAWLFPPLLCLAAAITLLGAQGLPSRWEALRPSPDVRHGTPRAALADPRFRRLLAVFVANGIAAALPATLVLFFVADVLEATASSGLFLALYFAAGVAGLPAWVALARRIGRVAAWLVAMGVACLAFAFALSLGPGDVLPFALVCVASGAALGADLALPPALLADIAESREARGGAGAYFGWWNLVTKLNLALAAGLALPLLGLLGYRPGGSEGLVALALVYCLLPVVFKVLAAVLAWRWRDVLEVSS